MTYRDKSDFSLAFEIIRERGEMVSKLIEEGMSKEEAIETVKRENPMDDDMIDFIEGQKDKILKAIAIKESVYETKH